MVQIASFFKALSDDTRLRIMVLLQQKELCVCEICDITGESQPKISRHLAKLREAGLVRDERKSQWVFYRLSLEDKTAADVMRAIALHKQDNPMLEKDSEKLNAKVAQNCLCERVEAC